MRMRYARYDKSSLYITNLNTDDVFSPTVARAVVNSRRASLAYHHLAFSWAGWQHGISV
jgi:hypothetical protein